MEIGVTGMIMKHVQKHVEDHHKNEQENVITQHQLTVEIHVQDLMKIRKLAELLHAQVTIITQPFASTNQVSDHLK